MLSLYNKCQKQLYCNIYRLSRDSIYLHCLITKDEFHSAQTTACTVSFVAEQFQSTTCLYSSLQLTTLIITLTHIKIYYCHN